MSTQVTEAHYTLRRYVIFSAPDDGAQLIADSEALACDQLRAVFPKILAALGNGACCAPDVSVEFIESIPNEVAGVVAQLRAEVEREREWQAGVLANAKLHHAERKDAIARAERAEASLRALRLVCGTTDADKFTTWVDRANARAEKAEAELAGIRALADRRNKRYHVEDTTHQLVAALDQALDIAQAELAQFRELDAERARMCQIAVDKRIRTPTPRTDEEAGSLIDAEEVVPADFSRELERELAKERARLDSGQILLTVAGERVWHCRVDLRAAIDAAMKEETK